ncbi:hypothetical protein BJF78_24265 [Pseudonocardia sp. CNS-139]|nr:hypothetical protein BJF78_24265 [Pseudonocardia sp. CNS-139]
MRGGHHERCGRRVSAASTAPMSMPVTHSSSRTPPTWTMIPTMPKTTDASRPSSSAPDEA